MMVMNTDPIRKNYCSLPIGSGAWWFTMAQSVKNSPTKQIQETKVTWGFQYMFKKNQGFLLRFYKPPA